MGSLVKSVKHLRNKLCQFSTISFRICKWRKYFLIHSIKPKLTVIPKPDNGITRREKYKPISLKNIDANNFKLDIFHKINSKWIIDLKCGS